MANRKTGKTGAWQASAGTARKSGRTGKARKRSATARAIAAGTRKSATTRKASKTRKSSHRAKKTSSSVVREPETVIRVSPGSRRSAAFSVIVERSLFGTPLARRIRSYTSDETAAQIIRRASEISHQTGRQGEG